jgi:hypothetical protein
MKILGQVQIEDRQAELIEFLGYEIPDRFTVRMQFSLETFDDPQRKNVFLEPPFVVKFCYEIGAEGTPSVVEVRIQGTQNERASESDPLANDFGIYEGIEIQGFGIRGRVFRHHLGFVEKKFTDILITGLQFVIQGEYKKQDLRSGKQIEYKIRKVDRPSLLVFEKKIREEVGAIRKLTPEFLNRILKERAKYKSLRGSHYGFNDYLAGKEMVSVKAVEKWIAKAESNLKTPRPRSTNKTKKVSASKAGSKVTPKARKEKR